MTDPTIFETIVLAMPYVFLTVYAAIAWRLPRFRWVGVIVATSALVNIAIDPWAPSSYPAVLGLCIVIDITTASLILATKQTVIRGHDFGILGGYYQARIFLLAAVFNAVVIIDFHQFGYVLGSVYIPIIFTLNIAQLLMMGRDIHGNRIRSSRTRPLGTHTDVVGLALGRYGGVPDGHPSDFENGGQT